MQCTAEGAGPSADKYLAVVSDASPFLTIYDYSNEDQPLRIPTPSQFPAGPATWCEWAPESVILCVTSAGAGNPKVAWYNVVSNIATKFANPVLLPINNGSKTAWSSDGRYCAVGCAPALGNQTWFIYDFQSGFPVGLAGVPAFTAGVINLSWRPDTHEILINEDLYEVVAGIPVFLQIVTPIGTIDSRWSVDGVYLCQMGIVTPFIALWDFSGIPVALPQPAVIPPSTGRSPDWDKINIDILTTVHNHVGASPGNDSTRYTLTSGLAVTIADMIPEPSVTGPGAPAVIRYRNTNTLFAISSTQEISPLFIYDNTAVPPEQVPPPIPGPPNSQTNCIGWGGQDAFTLPPIVDKYLAVVSNASPFLFIYDYTVINNAVRIPPAATIPPGPQNWAEWQPDSTILCIVGENSPEVSWYDVIANVATKIADPAVLPTTTGLKCAWSSDGRYCAVGGTSGGGAPQTWFIYDFLSGSPVEIGTVPTLTAAVINLSWRPATYEIMVNEFLYDVDTGTPVFLQNMTAISTGDSRWSIDGRYACQVGAVSPFIAFWDFAGAPAQLGNPAVLPPSQGKSVDWDKINPFICTVMHNFVGSPPGNNSTRYTLASGGPVAILDMIPEVSDVSTAGITLSIRYRNDNSRFAISSVAGTPLFIYNNSDVPPTISVPPNPAVPTDSANCAAWGGQDPDSPPVVGPDFTLWNSDVDLQGYDFDGTDITTRGNASPATTLSLQGPNRGTVARLTDTAVAVGASDDFNTRQLVKMEFDGTNWNQVGNTFTLPNSFVSVAGLGPNRVSVTASFGGGMFTYDFDGFDWSQTGNGNVAATAEVTSATSALSVALFNTGFDRLDGQIFDGTDWNANGKSTVIFFDAFGICAMTATRIAIFDGDAGELKVFDEGASDYAQVGNGLSIPGQGRMCMAALGAGRIVLGSNLDSWLRIYDFDGTDWTQVGNELSGVAVPEWNNLAQGSYSFF